MEPAKEFAIEVSDLKIRYKCLNRISIKNSLFSLKKSQVDVFEAVKGISFQVPKGEIMGIVGKNGSGKSTMLRAIAGIFAAWAYSVAAVDRRRLSKEADREREYFFKRDAVRVQRRAGICQAG